MKAYENRTILSRDIANTCSTGTAFTNICNLRGARLYHFIIHLREFQMPDFENIPITLVTRMSYCRNLKSQLHCGIDLNLCF